MAQREVHILTNRQIVDAVRAWQSDPSRHHLTCQDDGRHRLLQAVEERPSAVLRCPDCAYRQAYIPALVLRRFLEHPATFSTVGRTPAEPLQLP